MTGEPDVLDRLATAFPVPEPSFERFTRRRERKRRKQRIGSALVATLVATLAIGWVITEFADRGAQPAHEIVERTISSSALILNGRVRCTATVRTPVQAGRQTGLTFALHNVSDNPAEVSIAPWDLTFVVKAADGTRYDTKIPWMRPVPFIQPRELLPGSTVTAHGADARVKWAGPLSITPHCGRTALPPLRMEVVAPGPAPTEPEAIADVAIATGPVLDRCQPLAVGVPVQGWIDPPNGDVPPMRAECSVTLHRQGPFLVARVLVVSPPDLGGVHVGGPYGIVTLPEQDGSAEAVVWDFVVTADGAVLVSGSSAGKTRPADAMMPEWSWTGTRWEGGGLSRCGGGWGGYGGSTPSTDIGLLFISVCPP